MRNNKHLVVAALIVAGLQLSACKHEEVNEAAAKEKENSGPAVVEKVEGKEISRLTLTEAAMKRIDLKTDEVREAKVSRSASMRKVVPYSALIYDAKGGTWIYTSPNPGTFERQGVEVDYIDKNVAVLKNGPEVGTVVASVGVAELFGTEFKINGEE
jgi:hypothetical protein